MHCCAVSTSENPVLPIIIMDNTDRAYTARRTRPTANGFYNFQET